MADHDRSNSFGSAHCTGRQHYLRPTALVRLREPIGRIQLGHSFGSMVALMAMVGSPPYPTRIVVLS